MEDIDNNKKPSSYQKYKDYQTKYHHEKHNCAICNKQLTHIGFRTHKFTYEHKYNELLKKYNDLVSQLQNIKP